MHFWAGFFSSTFQHSDFNPVSPMNFRIGGEVAARSRFGSGSGDSRNQAWRKYERSLQQQQRELLRGAVTKFCIAAACHSCAAPHERYQALVLSVCLLFGVTALALTQLTHSLVTSAFLYAYESWTLTAELQRRLTSDGNEVLLQDATHLIQRPCHQRGSPCQDPAGYRTTRRPPYHRKEMQTAVVWSCLPFIRSGQTIL